MESNITEPEYFSNDSLGEPHFEEEATIASARPVVPLEEIRAATVSRKRLAFGLSILVSLVVGALGATFVYKYRNSRPASAVVETAVTGVAAKSEEPPVDNQSPEPAAGPAEAIEATVDDQQVDGQQEANVVTEKPVAVRIKRQTASIPQQDDLATRRQERKEARRQRRITEREAEREALRNRRRGDDLLRIREIFEGSRTP